MQETEVVLVEGARTPLTAFCGSFRDVSAIDLGAVAAQEAIKRAGITSEDVDNVVVGNVIQSSSDAIYFARHVGLKAGIPQDVPALTVNRLCGSGLQAIVTAAQDIMLGHSEVALAGGAENMSQVPHVVRGARWGLPLGKGQLEDYLWESLYDPYGGCSMAITAENLAEKYGITREQADQFAFNSHLRARRAMEKGYFKQEIVPVPVKDHKGREKVIDTDEHPRETTVDQLGKLSPRFKEEGIVTAGNASGINDGAAAVVLTSLRYAEKHDLRPLARLVATGIVGVDPKIMGIGPVPAIKKALKQANMTLEELDLIEINEAFAPQYLACQKELDFNPEIGNVNGGAVALGHPLAASGTRITLSLVYELKRRNKKWGASALCIGGGQGIATIWEVF